MLWIGSQLQRWFVLIQVYSPAIFLWVTYPRKADFHPESMSTQHYFYLTVLVLMHIRLPSLSRSNTHTHMHAHIQWKKSAIISEKYAKYFSSEPLMHSSLRWNHMREKMYCMYKQSISTKRKKSERRYKMNAEETRGRSKDKVKRKHTLQNETSYDSNKLGRKTTRLHKLFSQISQLRFHKQRSLLLWSYSNTASEWW